MRFGFISAGVLALGLLGGSAHAANIVVNGGFETLTNGAGQLGYNTDATGWTTTGYNFVFAPGTADTTGSTGQYGGLTLWGPNNGAANGLPATSPDGGNFVAADGDYMTHPLEQTLSGLTVGHKYDVSFWYGFGQQEGYNGDTIQHWLVSLGNTSEATADYTVPNHGFTGWMQTTMSFTATSASEVLSFLAYGNLPVPPFALLDGVSVQDTSVPEPASIAMLLAGVGGLTAVVRRRRNRR